MTLLKQARRKRQRGVAMVMALLALLLLAIIGMAFLSMTMTESSANNNYKDSQKAYFASRAGLENVRALLWSDTNFATQVASLKMPNPTQSGMIYVLNPTGTEVIDPKANPALDDELCHEQYVQLVATVTPGTAGAPCGTGGAIGELMPPASAYYKSAAVPPAPPAAGPDIVLNNGEILDTNTTSALPFKWVRVTNKQNFMGLMSKNVDGTLLGGPTAGNQVCWDGTQETVMLAGVTCAAWSAAHTFNQANPVWLLTSLAITPAGSRRMTQMEVAFTPPVYPDGAITALAPITITGSLQVNGYDNCTCTSTNTDRPGMICNNGASGAYAVASGTSISTNGNASTLTSGQSSPTQVLNPFPYNVPNLISNYIKDGPVDVSQAPNQATSCSGTPNFMSTPAVYATCSNITGKNGAQSFGTFPTGLPDNPTNSDPQLTYIPGSVSLHADISGSGVLIIDGDLDVNGGLSWYGLILVRGRISFTGGGSQTVNVYGALLAGEDVNAQDKALDDKVGGSFSFHYDTCALKQDAPPGPPKLLATHELMY